MLWEIFSHLLQPINVLASCCGKYSVWVSPWISTTFEFYHTSCMPSTVSYTGVLGTLIDHGDALAHSSQCCTQLKSEQGFKTRWIF